MNQTKRIYLSRGSNTKIFVFDPQKSLAELLKKALDKFSIAFEDRFNNSYRFALLIQGRKFFIVEETDDLQAEDEVHLLTLNELTELKPAKVENQSENVHEILSSKENLIEKPFTNKESLELPVTQERSKSEENDEECHEICLDEISSKEFESRSALSSYVGQWALSQKFSVAFNTRERELIKEKCKVSELECSENKCPFYLQFKTKGKDNSYILAKSNNCHNHPLDRMDDARSMTKEIYDRIKILKDSVKKLDKLRNQINNEFNKNFTEQTIRHQLNKIKEEEYGKASLDAQKLVELLTKDVLERKYFFKTKYNENKQLQSLCFMTSKMLKLSNEFNDVVIIDTTHKTNRFNLPLLDIIIIDNLGRSCTCFVSLLSDQTEASFNWALSAFKSKLKKCPAVIFSDEEEALISSYLFLSKN